MPSHNRCIPTITTTAMPRPSKRGQALEALDNAIESGIFVYLIESSSSEDELETIEELLIIRESITALGSLSTGESAGRHGGNCLEAYIYQYNYSTLRSLFRMHQALFWQLVELLTRAVGVRYWNQPEAGDAAPGPRRPLRPIYYQVAVGLYVLGGGTTVSKAQVTMNVSQGSTWQYAWRTIMLLARLLDEFVRWSAKGTT